MIAYALSTAEALTFQRTPIVTFGYIMQVIISLAIVLGLIYVSSKFLLPRLKFSPKGRLIEMVERIGLEPGLSIYVVRVKDKNYILAAGQKGVALLDKYSTNDTEEGAEN
ncbi:MAG: FliO/MopB family protein [Candidatus Saganbacteria bacterium]|nr:FliO/MopB family protein [Candidatus Saganbacteria bacterium]